MLLTDLEAAQEVFIGRLLRKRFWKETGWFLGLLKVMQTLIVLR
jgi:hypothetical protein